MLPWSRLSTFKDESQASDLLIVGHSNQMQEC